VGADGKPDVVPVWHDDVLWIFTGIDSVKVRNLASNSNVGLHWQVDERGDGVELWGRQRCTPNWKPSVGCGPVSSPTPSKTSHLLA
jgi:general stress protein 26